MADQLESTKNLIRITTENYGEEEHMFLKEQVAGYSADDDCTLLIYLISGATIKVGCQDPSGLGVALISELGWS